MKATSKTNTTRTLIHFQMQFELQKRGRHRDAFRAEPQQRRKRHERRIR